MDTVWCIDFEHELVCHREHNQSDLKDCVLMQYTGLKDCEGNEIYEGDFLEMYIPNWCDKKEKEIFEVTYDYNYLAYLKLVLEHCEECNYEGEKDYVKVIGNIYEKKEGE